MYAADAPFCRNRLLTERYAACPHGRLHVDAEPKFLCGIDDNGRVERDRVPVV